MISACCHPVSVSAATVARGTPPSSSTSKTRRTAGRCRATCPAARFATVRRFCRAPKSALSDVGDDDFAVQQRPSWQRGGRPYQFRKGGREIAKVSTEHLYV